MLTIGHSITDPPPRRFTAFGALARVPLPDPRGVEVRVLDRLARRLALGVEREVLSREVVAVAHVEALVAGLDDRRIVVRASPGTGRVVFEVSFPLPCLPLVVGDLDQEARAPALGVVSDQDPVAAAER